MAAACLIFFVLGLAPGIVLGGSTLAFCRALLYLKWPLYGRKNAWLLTLGHLKLPSFTLPGLVRVQGEICLTSSTGNEKQRLLDEALQFLQSLRSVLHAFNKDIAKAEDIIAEMFCLTLQSESAIHHCKVSIQILEKLYHSDHIVIANELVKLVSIELSLNKYACAKKNLARIDHIFSRHYGCNYVKMFPYLITLQR